MSLCVSVVMGCDPKEETEEPVSGDVCDSSEGNVVTVSQSPDEHETGYMNAETEGLCEKHYGFTQTNETFNAYFKEKYGKDFSYNSVKSCKDHENIAHVVFCPISIDGHLDEEDYKLLSGCNLANGTGCTEDMEAFGDMHICKCSDGKTERCGKDNIIKCDGGNTSCNCATGENCSEEELQTCNPSLECGDDEHIYNDACEPDSIENCGKHDKKCVAENGTLACVKKECVVDSCETGYVLDYGKCVAIGDVVCPDMFHVNGDACELDTAENCGKHGNQCPGIENGSPACVRGTCDISCNSGYHLYDSEDGKICEEDTLLQCGSHDRDCGAVLEHAEAFVCDNGSCLATLCEVGYHVHEESHKCVINEISCDKDYHLYKNSCEMDDDENCGEHGVLCHDDHGFSVCWERACMSTTCEAGYHVPLYPDELEKWNPFRSCVPDCEKGTHWNHRREKCVEDDFYNCGEDQRSCRYFGMINGECINGECVATECYDRYNLVDGECVPCKTGYHGYEGSCEKDTYENCGRHGRKCTVSDTDKSNHIISKSCMIDMDEGIHYESAICEVAKCEDGYYRELIEKRAGVSYARGCTPCEDSDFNYSHIYEDKCERDTVDNCGSHGHSCWDEDISKNAKQMSCRRDRKCYISECKNGYYFKEIDGKDYCVAECDTNEIVVDSGMRCTRMTCSANAICEKLVATHGTGVCNNGLCEMSCDDGFVYDPIKKDCSPKP